MNKLTKILYKELYRKSFYDFAKDFWHVIEPRPFVDGILVQFFCETFQYMCKPWIGYNEINIDTSKLDKDAIILDVRQNKNKLNINVPPRHSKSLIFNVLAAVWIWSFYPLKVASISHTQGLAGKMNRLRQVLINSDEYKEIFEDIELTTNTGSTLTDKRGGELYSINRNAMTGYGGDIIINDDLTNAETARKDKEEMNNAWSYYQNTMPSRINDTSKYIILNIQQRLAPNDITGHIMSDPKLSEEYAFIILPAIFTKKTYLICPITGTIYEFQKGEPLWKERFGDYQGLRFQVGDAVFDTQYLQNPIASDKTVIKDEMIIEKNVLEVPSIEEADMIYASHDFPVKDKDTSDFLGSVLAYRVGSTLYIKDCLEKKMAFVKSVNYVKQLDDFYPGIIQVIEDKANGSPILQQLQDEVSGMQAFQPGTQSKMQRLESASLYMNSKNVIFVKDKFNDFTKEYQLSMNLANLKKRLLDFPFVEHDDITDAFSMLLLYVFMDKKYSVYGRAFNSENIIDTVDNKLYNTIFFNKEGDNWKVLDIGVEYGEQTKLIVNRETMFKASVDEGLQKLKEFAPNKKIFIDCSATDALAGMYQKNSSVERYIIEDFDKSVAQTSLAFSKKLILINNTCKQTQIDIESFKFSKSKDETVKYITEKDGFVACIRMALQYYGGIV